MVTQQARGFCRRASKAHYFGFVLTPEKCLPRLMGEGNTPDEKLFFIDPGSALYSQDVHVPSERYYCGWTNSCTTLEPWLKPVFGLIFTGESNHSLGFLNGDALHGVREPADLLIARRPGEPEKRAAKTMGPWAWGACRVEPWHQTCSICLQPVLIFPLLVLKGIYHCWKNMFGFFWPGGLRKWQKCSGKGP